MEEIGTYGRKRCHFYEENYTFKKKFALMEEKIILWIKTALYGTNLHLWKKSTFFMEREYQQNLRPTSTNKVCYTGILVNNELAFLHAGLACLQFSSGIQYYNQYKYYNFLCGI